MLAYLLIYTSDMAQDHHPTEPKVPYPLAVRTATSESIYPMHPCGTQRCTWVHSCTHGHNLPASGPMTLKIGRLDP